jgi:hypothetical protein
MPSPGGRSPRWPATSTGAVRSGWEGSGIPSTSRWVTTPRQRAALLRTPNLTSGALTRHGRATRGSYQVTPPSRTRRRHRSRRGRPILAKTATSRQSTEGHTPSERCRPHPISLPTDATNYNVQDHQRSHCPVEEPDRETPDSDVGGRRWWRQRSRHGCCGGVVGVVLLVFELALVARMMLDWVGYWLPGAGGGRSRRAGWRTP